ncbi:MAG: hypothetical protein RLZZ08_365 [Pseudomonadota bacterium]
MTRIIASAAVTAVAALGLCAAVAPLPAAAQERAGDKVNTLIIYGDDQCPQSSADQITVCARLAENERFRIPQNLRESSSPQNEAWANKVLAYETVGNFGPLSCSPVGLGGELGCTAQMIEQAYAEKAHGSDVRFSQLIAAARAERLSTVDAEAAATQGRVEELERQYDARVAREQAAADAAEAAASPPPPKNLATPPQP